MTEFEVVIIGYGNTLRSDDGFGPAVAERLSTHISDRRVRIMLRQLLTVELITDLAQARLCILVDASTTGHVGCLNVREVEAESIEIGALDHDLSAASLIGLARQLLGSAPRCFLYSVVPESVELGEQLTPGTAALAEQAVGMILDRVRGYFAEASR